MHGGATQLLRTRPNGQFSDSSSLESSASARAARIRRSFSTGGGAVGRGIIWFGGVRGASQVKSMTGAKFRSTLRSSLRRCARSCSSMGNSSMFWASVPIWAVTIGIRVRSLSFLAREIRRLTCLRARVDGFLVSQRIWSRRSLSSWMEMEVMVSVGVLLRGEIRLWGTAFWKSEGSEGGGEPSQPPILDLWIFLLNPRGKIEDSSYMYWLANKN